LTTTPEFIQAHALNSCPINGILLYYIQRLLGVQMKTKLDEYTPHYIAVPVLRQFPLTALDAYLFASKF
jgi:hypothetical protein